MGKALGEGPGGPSVRDRLPGHLELGLRDPACFHENYNSKTGMPVGAMYFGWSNAFAIKFVLDWEKKGI